MNEGATRVFFVTIPRPAAISSENNKLAGGYIQFTGDITHTNDSNYHQDRIKLKKKLERYKI